MNYSVCVVIVTYNRLTDLITTLEEYEKQTYCPGTLIVIDNAATDGTHEFLEEWKKGSGRFERLIVHSERNLGGAGGFALGIKEAVKTDCEFVFLADDDAVPDIDMLEKLLDGYDTIKDKDSIAAMCTRVNDQYGISHIHRSRVRTGLVSISRYPIPDEEYQNRLFDVDLLTFVGALIRKDAIEKVGLPLEEYFIHEDDAEYSTRLKKEGRIVCVSDSVMTHPYGGNDTKDWIEYYTTRNYVDYIGRHYPQRYQVFAMFDKYVKKSSIIARLLKHRSKNYRKMNVIAIKDGKNGRLGISEEYKPGQVIG